MVLQGTYNVGNEGQKSLSDAQMKISQNILKGCLIFFGLLAILFLIVWGVSFYRSKGCYVQGVAYFDKGEYIKSVTYFDRSIHWYTPLNPYVQRSAEKLWQMSKDAQRRGDIKLALIAVRTIRRGFFAARSLYTPGKEWIRKCDKRIEEVWAIQKGRQGAEAGDKGGEPFKTRLQNQESRAPDPFWSSMLLLGLFGWIGSIIMFILRGFHKNCEGRFVLKPHLNWLGLGAIFFVIWVVGMMRA